MIPRKIHAPSARQTQTALRASEARYRRLFESAKDGILILDADNGRIVDVNPFMVKLLGYSHAEFLGKELWQIGFFEDAVASKLTFLELQDKGYVRYEDLPLKTAAKRHIDVEFVSNVYQVNHKKVIQCNIRVITQRKEAEEALRNSEGLNRNLVEHLPHRIVVKDRNSVVLFCNANYAKNLSLPREDIIGKDAFALYPRELAEAYQADDQAVIASEQIKDFEERYEVGGEERWVHTVKVPYRDEQGNVIGVLGVFEDVTERKQLEEQFRQSQKLEGIGRLAGGVAHDFNNLLTGILGYCDLLTSELRQDDPLAADIDQIRKCGERGANLTRQLLAFSRKQVLEVRVLDLNALVAESQSMLQRLIGEDIELQTVLAASLGRVKADQGQIEQVIMNLVVNARDAMPDGGKITLETANAELDEHYAGSHLAVIPGSYVMLAVTDAGCGMDEATKTRLFEPFFTTKEPGKGTGLGLASVYGIVKQNSGNVWCYSELGQGTIFKIYLPRVEESSEIIATESTAAATPGSETVLLAEDDELVRNLIVQMLTRNGYEVISTKNGAEAIRECEHSPGPIHLLITDVVMPGMSGNQLNQRLAELRPEMRVLFMSGYTGDAMLQHGMLAEEMPFLQKPFTRDSLNRKVREILDR
jgi:PAS domain S-box-containing protein